MNSASSVPKPKTTRDDSRSALSCCAQARGKRIPRRTFGKSRIQPFAGTARFAKAYLDFCASIFIVQYIFFSPFLSIGKERSKQIYFEKREKPEENSVSAVKPVADAKFVANAGRVSAVKPVADAEFVANAGKGNGNTGKFFSNICYVHLKLFDGHQKVSITLGFSRQACSRRRVRCECREEERKHRQIFFLYLLCSLEAF